MTVSFQGSALSASTSTTTLTVPAGVVAGDVMIVGVTSTSAAANVTIAGWLVLLSTSSGSVDTYFTALTRTATSGDAGSNYTITGAAGAWSLSYYRSTTGNAAFGSFNATTDTSGTSITAPTLTYTTDTGGAVLACLFFSGSGALSFDNLALHGFTQRFFDVNHQQADCDNSYGAGVDLAFVTMPQQGGAFTFIRAALSAAIVDAATTPAFIVGEIRMIVRAPTHRKCSLLVSSDAVNWTPISQPYDLGQSNAGVYAVRWANFVKSGGGSVQRFYAVAGAANPFGALIESSDGNAWADAGLAILNSFPSYAIGTIKDGGSLGASQYGVTVLSTFSPAALDGSKDGGAFSVVTTPPTGAPGNNLSICGIGSGAWVFGQNNGRAISVSTDLSSYTSFPNSWGGVNQLQNVTFIEYDGAGVVLVGALFILGEPFDVEAQLLRSTDNGVSWTHLLPANINPGAPGALFSDAAYSPALGRWVIVGSGMTDSSGTGGAGTGSWSLLTSNDGGMTWTGHNPAAFGSGRPTRVVWASSVALFVAVDLNIVNSYFVSSDGVTWTSRNFPLSSTILFNDLDYSPQLGLLVAATAEFLFP